MKEKNSAFTLIEILVVALIIGFLATIITLAGHKYITKSREAEREADLKSIENTIKTKRIESGKVLGEITKSWDSESNCRSSGPKSSGCINSMKKAFLSLGYNDAQYDPWGYVYRIDENEMEPGPTPCRYDQLKSTNYQNPEETDKVINIDFFFCEVEDQEPN